MNKFLTILLLLILIILPTNKSYASEVIQPELIKTTPVTSGAILKEYRWQMSSGNVNISVIEVDLANPYVQAGAILGAGQFTKRLNVSAMAKNTGAVAAVNGDYYNTQAEGVPIGPMVISSTLASSPSVLEETYALGISAERKAYIESFSFEGRVKAPNGVVYILSGLNKTAYLEEPDGVNSHVNKLHLYSDLWGGNTRGDGSNTTPTEMLIKDGIVVEIKAGSYFSYAVPKGSYILRSHGDAAKFLVNNFKSGDTVDIQYTMNPDLNWEMVIGGHALLVNDGIAVPYARNSASLDGARARTAVGISSDRNVLYIIGVERDIPQSVGLKLADLSNFIASIGIYRALNMDGGGSATMVSRPLGEWDTVQVLKTEQIRERHVVNAIGIYSTAPMGKLSGLLIDGENLILINEEIDYSLKGYDEYYNPVNVSELTVAWKETGNLGLFNANRFLAIKPGITEITAGIDDTKKNITVQIIGKNDVSKMILSVLSGNGSIGSQNKLQLDLITETGESRIVPAGLVDWELYGIKGQTSSEGILTINDTKGNGIGFVVARYQGFSAPLAIQFKGQKEILAFNNMQGISFESYPQGVTGKLSIVGDPADATVKVARLDYDFTKSQGTTAAYIRFADSGIPFEFTVESISVSVFGSLGNEWIRAEVEDGNGISHRLDLCTGVDWSGWKTLKISTKGLIGPITLKRIYVVAEEVPAGLRNKQGSIFLKGLTFNYAAGEIKPVEEQVLELAIGQKTLTINGVKTEMDVVPVVVNGRTLVPIRFLSEALGATVAWDETAKVATIIKGKRWIDIWSGENTMAVDGNAVHTDVAPQLIQGRIMIPLRAVAESLDLNVQWDPATGKITLR